VNLDWRSQARLTGVILRTGAYGEPVQAKRTGSRLVRVSKPGSKPLYRSVGLDVLLHFFVVGVGIHMHVHSGPHVVGGLG
jgi:hypothetical protein